MTSPLGLVATRHIAEISASIRLVEVRVKGKVYGKKSGVSDVQYESSCLDLGSPMDSPMEKLKTRK